MSTQVVPHNLEAEESLIGAMLLKWEAVETALSMMSVDDWYSPQWANVFVAMDRLYKDGETIEPVSVAAECARLGLQINTADLLSAQAGCPATSNAARYCKIIVDMAGLRRLQRLGMELAEAAREGGVPATELLLSVRESLDTFDVLSDRTQLPDGFAWMEDFLADVEENPAPWLIPGLIKVLWRALIVGSEGAGKSTVLRQIALAAAAGVHPFTRKPIDRIRTLLIDLENPDEAIDLMCRPMYDEANRLGVWEDQTCGIIRRPGGIDLRQRRDRIDLETVIRSVRPELVCVGPAYKTFVSRGGDDEVATRETIGVFDDLRTRYDFALLLEIHAAKGDSSQHREMRPKGSTLWMQWPEMGMGMVPVQDEEGSFHLKRFRGDRLPNNWPDRIERSGGAWPWTGVWTQTGGVHQTVRDDPPPYGDDERF